MSKKRVVSHQIYFNREEQREIARMFEECMNDLSFDADLKYALVTSMAAQIEDLNDNGCSGGFLNWFKELLSSKEGVLFA